MASVDVNGFASAPAPLSASTSELSQTITAVDTTVMPQASPMATTAGSRPLGIIAPARAATGPPSSVAASPATDPVRFAPTRSRSTSSRSRSAKAVAVRSPS